MDRPRSGGHLPKMGTSSMSYRRRRCAAEVGKRQPHAGATVVTITVFFWPLGRSNTKPHRS